MMMKSVLLTICMSRNLDASPSVFVTTLTSTSSCVIFAAIC